MIGEFMIKE